MVGAPPTNGSSQAFRLCINTKQCTLDHFTGLDRMGPARPQAVPEPRQHNDHEERQLPDDARAMKAEESKQRGKERPVPLQGPIYENKAA